MDSDDLQFRFVIPKPKARNLLSLAASKLAATSRFFDG